MIKNIILASKSEVRKKILEKNAIFYEVIGETQKDYLDLDKEFNIHLTDLNKFNSFWFRSYFKEN